MEIAFNESRVYAAQFNTILSQKMKLLWILFKVLRKFPNSLSAPELRRRPERIAKRTLVGIFYHAMVNFLCIK